jgi:hypothetical protein
MHGTHTVLGDTAVFMNDLAEQMAHIVAVG